MKTQENQPVPAQFIADIRYQALKASRIQTDQFRARALVKKLTFISQSYDETEGSAEVFMTIADEIGKDKSVALHQTCRDIFNEKTSKPIFAKLALIQLLIHETTEDNIHFVSREVTKNRVLFTNEERTSFINICNKWLSRLQAQEELPTLVIKSEQATSLKPKIETSESALLDFSKKILRRWMKTTDFTTGLAKQKNSEDTVLVLNFCESHS